jgi:hypothetical protein
MNVKQPDRLDDEDLRIEDQGDEDKDLRCKECGADTDKKHDWQCSFADWDAESPHEVELSMDWDDDEDEEQDALHTIEQYEAQEQEWHPEW